MFEQATRLLLISLLPGCMKKCPPTPANNNNTRPQTKFVVVLLLLPALQPAPISNSLLAKEERIWVEVAQSPTLNLRV
jgi:hypothetical protein